MDDPKSPMSPSSSSSSSSSRASSKEPDSPRSEANKSRSNSPNEPVDPEETSNLDNGAADNESEKNDDLKEPGEEQEDLSDVSDAESLDFGDEQSKAKEEQEPQQEPLESVNDLRQKLDEIRSNQPAEVTNGITTENEEDKKENDEDALDFEAEEGECSDVKEKDDDDEDEADTKKLELSEPEEGEELEEGEVTDEDGKRAEESESKPVCRFYTRGQCTWGISCRFLHPGVTDKGNYTMFDMVRPMPAQPPAYGMAPFHDAPPFRDARAHIIALQQPPYMPPHVRPPPGVPTTEPNSESAWERGLRTAKEMMRRANKRKEQDVDFDEKKMNLSLAQEEIEKDNYYTRDRASPEEPPPVRTPVAAPYGRYNAYSPPFGRPHHQPPPYEEIDQFGRMPRHHYREHKRVGHYEEGGGGVKHKSRPTREVIVQKADDWNDPWMRKKTPTKGARRRSRSRSSDSSYSSSSSSQSGSSSDSSQSNSSQGKRYYAAAHRRAGNHEKVVPQKRRREVHSPVGKRQYSPVRRRESPPYSKRTENSSLMVMSKKAISRDTRIREVPRQRRGSTPPLKRKRSASANSESSDSSDSGSESSDSSSSNSSSGSAPKTPPRVATKKRGVSKSNTTPPSETKSTPNSKKANRREELLKQLKAVEDAIARKRSKLN